MSKHLATVARKNFLLTGRNLGQIQTQRWAGSDDTVWFERERRGGKRGRGKRQMYFPKFYWRGPTDPLPNLCLHHFQIKPTPLHTHHTHHYYYHSNIARHDSFYNQPWEVFSLLSGKCKGLFSKINQLFLVQKHAVTQFAQQATSCPVRMDSNLISRGA